MFKNIFVGIMVENFKTIRDDFIEQCMEREEDLEIGQKGLLLEVELAIRHASFSRTSLRGRRTSLECSGRSGSSGLIPFLSQVPRLPSIAEISSNHSARDSMPAFQWVFHSLRSSSRRFQMQR